MAKSKIWLRSDIAILESGTRADILALAAQFQAPATAVDRNGTGFSAYLWKRLDLDCVALMRELELPIGADSPFLAHSVEGDLDDKIAQTVIRRLEAIEALGHDLRAKSASGGTLIDNLARGFHPALADFLEARGFGFLDQTIAGESLFDVVLRRVLTHNGSSGFGGLGSLRALMGAHALPKTILAAFDVFDESDRQRELRAAWLVRCVERGAPFSRDRLDALVPPNPLLQIPQLASAFGAAMQQQAPLAAALGASMHQKALAAHDSGLVARLEAAALRASLVNAPSASDQAELPARSVRRSPRV
jgi:hypothetical protein